MYVYNNKNIRVKFAKKRKILEDPLSAAHSNIYHRLFFSMIILLVSVCVCVCVFFCLGICIIHELLFLQSLLLIELLLISFWQFFLAVLDCSCKYLSRKYNFSKVELGFSFIVTTYIFVLQRSPSPFDHFLMVPGLRFCPDSNPVCSDSRSKMVQTYSNSTAWNKISSEN